MLETKRSCSYYYEIGQSRMPLSKDIILMSIAIYKGHFLLYIKVILEYGPSIKSQINCKIRYYQHNAVPE